MPRVLRRSARVLTLVAAAGFAASAYVFLTLPDVRLLRTKNPSATAFMQLRDRQAEAEGDDPRRIQRFVPYGRISLDLKRAVLAAEDSGFWQHEGIDIKEIRKSLELDLEHGELLRGGSTITQQLAKNLYLSPSKTPLRKLRELLIARRLEAELSKRRILELYLNVIEWGDGIYGADSAARAYFRSSAATLDAEQSALLAAAIVNPHLLNPQHPTARLRRRQMLILRRMGAVIPPADTTSDTRP